MPHSDLEAWSRFTLLTPQLIQVNRDVAGSPERRADGACKPAELRARQRREEKAPSCATLVNRSGRHWQDTEARPSRRPLQTEDAGATCPGTGGGTRKQAEGPEAGTNRERGGEHEGMFADRDLQADGT